MSSNSEHVNVKHGHTGERLRAEMNTEERISYFVV